MSYHVGGDLFPGNVTLIDSTPRCFHCVHTRGYVVIFKGAFVVTLPEQPEVSEIAGAHSPETDFQGRDLRQHLPFDGVTLLGTNPQFDGFGLPWS